jgi:hypothetical protein
VITGPGSTSSTVPSTRNSWHLASTCSRITASCLGSSSGAGGGSASIVFSGNGEIGASGKSNASCTGTPSTRRAAGRCGRGEGVRRSGGSTPPDALAATEERRGAGSSLTTATWRRRRMLKLASPKRSRATSGGLGAPGWRSWWRRSSFRLISPRFRSSRRRAQRAAISERLWVTTPATPANTCTSEPRTPKTTPASSAPAHSTIAPTGPSDPWSPPATSRPISPPHSSSPPRYAVRPTSAPSNPLPPTIATVHAVPTTAADSSSCPRSQRHPTTTIATGTAGASAPSRPTTIPAIAAPPQERRLWTTSLPAANSDGSSG